MYKSIINLLVVVCAISCSQYNKNKDHGIDTGLGFSSGPNVGEKIPVFSLPDQNGNIKSVNDLIGENGAIINFHRSASW